MTGEPVITVVGNLTADPELRFSPNGSAVANFTIASTPRTFDRQSNEWKDGETLFMRCSLWREPAENVAESLTKGTRVIAEGRLKSRSFETKEGEKRTVQELEVEEIGPSMRYATAKVTRAERGNSGGQAQQGQQAQWPDPGFQQNPQYAQQGGQPYGQPPQQGQPYGQPQGQPYGQPQGYPQGQPQGYPQGQPQGQPQRQGEF